MRRDRLFVCVASGVALGLVVVLGLDRLTPIPMPIRVEPAVLAASALVADYDARGKPLPESVNLSELIAGGYLSPEQARGFDGADVTLSLNPDERLPQAAWIRVKLSDGHELALFNDGSVQAVARRN